MNLSMFIIPYQLHIIYKIREDMETLLNYNNLTYRWNFISLQVLISTNTHLKVIRIFFFFFYINWLSVCKLFFIHSCISFCIVDLLKFIQPRPSELTILSPHFYNIKCVYIQTLRWTELKEWLKLGELLYAIQQKKGPKESLVQK